MVPAFAGEDVDFLALLSSANRRRLLENSVRAVHAAGTVTAIATMLSARVRYDLRMIAVRSLGNLPERLAFDLLERASRFQLSAGKLEARATQEALAASIGSSREVVSRALKTLREAGIVETAPGMTRVLDPIRLAEMVRTFDS